MLKRSAGILVYKKVEDRLYVLLCHFGGPYWEGIDEGAWAIPKGELGKKEACVKAAKREFSEETNLDSNFDLEYLGSTKVSHRKLAIIFCSCKDFDLSKCKSNTFKLEWPKGSGKISEFPEMDKYEWMDISTAMRKIIPNQRYFIKKVLEKVGDC